MGTVGDNEHTRRLWDACAPRYDRDIRCCERFLFRGGRQWICEQATGEVLEIAVGTGRNLAFYPSRVRLTGVDLSPVMLAIARGRAAELGREVHLQQADAQALPFADASFDTVVCTLSLCSVADDRAAIAEMYRVLRPGGRLLLLDHVGSHHGALRAAQRLAEIFTVRFAGDHQTRRPLPLVERAGFVVSRSQRLKAGTVERLVAVKPGGADPSGDKRTT